jgi:tetratricopeptide (TPR) repeat protein
MRKLFFYYLIIIAIGLCCPGCRNDRKREEPSVPVSTISTPKELQDLNEKIRFDSTSATLYYTRAKYYLNVRDFNASLIDMSRVMQLDSMKPEYYLTIAELYMDGSHTSKSKAALEKCLSMDPKNTDALLKLAELYFYVKKYQESINYINDALKINNFLSKGYFLKGLNFKEIGDTSKAISSLVTATEQDPEYYGAFEELGVLYAAKKNSLAIGYFDNALRIDPKSTETLYNEGKFFQDTKEWEKAMASYQDLLKIEPNFKHAHYNLGAIELVKNKACDKAIKHFTDAINADANYFEAYYARGTAYLQKGDKSKARSDYQMALQIDPEDGPSKEALKELK